MRLIDADALIKTIRENDYLVVDYFNSKDRGMFTSGILQAIDEQPSAQPEQTDCEYCHEDSDGYVTPIEKNKHAFVRFGMNGWELDLKAKGWHGSAKISYCPMCGRRLTDE